MHLTPAQAAEAAKFKDTGKVIVHRGTTYSILAVPADEHRADSPYVLRSARGRYYALTRNRPKPEFLFGIGLYGSMNVLPGWFTDRTGELVSLG